MAMSVDSFRKLRKLMQLTLSDNDEEALGALRKANALLRAHAYDWNSAFDRLIKVESPVEMAQHQPSQTLRRADPEAERINNAFEAIEESDPRGSFADFIASLREQWDRSNRLTVAQKEALFKAAGQ
jgi:hypothetical protein